MHLVVQPAPACAGIGGVGTRALDGSARLSSLPSSRCSLPLLPPLRFVQQPRQQTCSNQRTPSTICQATRRKSTAGKTPDDAVGRRLSLLSGITRAERKYGACLRHA
jgi:hypothetical protein